MDLPVEEDHQICGVVILNDSNTFVYRCRTCDCEFSTGCGLEVHFLYEHTDKANDLNNSSCDLTTNDVSIEIVEQNLSGNENTEEIDALELPAPNPARKRKRKKLIAAAAAVSAAKVFYCDMCPSESFRSLRSIRKHMQCHSSNASLKQCKICGEHSISYEKHLKELHAIEDPYECDYCDATFKTDGRRLAHQRKHLRSPQPKFKHHCLECDRSFRTPGELQQHSNSIHEFIRPYVCDLCHKHFPSKQYIRQHLLSHGVKKFQCKYCGKKFKSISNKRGHERKIHETSNLQWLEIEFV